MADFEAQMARGPSNYLGTLRLIDDQVRRLVEWLDASGMDPPPAPGPGAGWR